MKDYFDNTPDHVYESFSKEAVEILEKHEEENPLSCFAVSSLTNGKKILSLSLNLKKGSKRDAEALFLKTYPNGVIGNEF